MLSALIRSEHSYPAIAPVGTTGTPAVRPSRSSRTRDSSPSNLQRPQQIETDNSVTFIPLGTTNPLFPHRGRSYLSVRLLRSPVSSDYILILSDLWRIVSEAADRMFSFEYLFFVFLGNRKTKSTIFLNPSRFKCSFSLMVSSTCLNTKYSSAFWECKECFLKNGISFS